MSAGTSVAGERWLDEQLTQLRAEHASVARVGAWLLARRVPLLVVLGAAMAVSVDAVVGSDNDLQLFVNAGRVLGSRHALDALANPAVQMGPLALALIAGFAAFASLAGIAAGIGATAGLAALAMYGALRVTAAVRPLEYRLAVIRDLGVGLSVALGPLAVAALFGQLPEVLVAVGLVGVGQLAQRRRDLAAGALLGLCVALKLWAILGLPVLLFALSPRGAARRGIALASVLVVAYGPFLLFGQVNTFSYRWTVDPESALGLVDGGSGFGWGMRLAQAAIVCAVGVVLVRLRGAEPWLVVAGIIAVRLLTDPARFAYYGAALVVCLLVGLWPQYAHRWAWFGPCSIATSVGVTVGDYLMTGSVGGVPRDLLLVVTLGYVIARCAAAPAVEPAGR